MTNGEKFKQIFSITQVDEGELYAFAWLPNHDAAEFSIEWWNAEYKEPKPGHWINKQHLLSSCSAECSSCHERSNGYVFDNGFSLEYEYYDFCPKCGADMREVEE